MKDFLCLCHHHRPVKAMKTKTLLCFFVFLSKIATEHGPGAAPKLYVTQLVHTNDWSLLQCEVQGASPQPDVQWQDSDGNTLTAEEPQVTTDGERYDVIINVTVTKTDTYQCVVTQKEIYHQINSTIYVHINGPVRVVVPDGDDVILPCSLNTRVDLEKKTFDWVKDRDTNHIEVFIYVAGKIYGNRLSGQDPRFKGRVSFFPEELRNSNASIKIHKTKIQDSGIYSCIFPQFNEQEFKIELVVVKVMRDRSGEIEGAAPRPYVTILDQTKDWSLLQCEVQGASPQPDVQWQDSDGNTLTAEEPQVTIDGERYDVIVNVTVTKTDTYRCVVTQKEIDHQTQAATYVYIHEKLPGSCHSTTTLITVFFAGAALVAAAVALWFLFKKLRKRYANKIRDSVTGINRSDPRYQLTELTEQTTVAVTPERNQFISPPQAGDEEINGSDQDLHQMNQTPSFKIVSTSDHITVQL